MTQPAEERDFREDLPPLSRDHAFWGMTATQFLGAFNDNLFKQLVLLICAAYVEREQLTSDPYQTVAQALFALPFVLFSGFGGWLADRTSKRTIVVLCKVAEIGVMLAGGIVFLIGTPGSYELILMLFVVLFGMGMQSAFFGPAKYGILPEMLHDHDLPAANGIIQMTTFLAIIFGTAVAGFGKVAFEDRLWNVSAMCVGIAVLGTLTSFLIRRTPVADAEMRFEPSSLAINRQTRHLLWTDPSLLNVLLISSLFWFAAGAVLPAVNTFGITQMGYPEDRTSLLAACIGVGIAVGCATAGKLSKHRVRFRLVTIAACGLVATFLLLSALPLPFLGLTAGQIEWAARGLLIVLGLFGGIFAVPLQVYLQARPPAGQKGRVIGAMNLVNWVGILLSAGFYFVCSAIFTPEAISWTFAVLAALLLPVAIFFRPPDVELE